MKKKQFKVAMAALASMPEKNVFTLFGIEVGGAVELDSLVGRWDRGVHSGLWVLATKILGIRPYTVYLL
jgi:hypothetical protein